MSYDQQLALGAALKVLGFYFTIIGVCGLSATCGFLWSRWRRRHKEGR